MRILASVLFIIIVFINSLHLQINAMQCFIAQDNFYQINQDFGCAADDISNSNTPTFSKKCCQLSAIELELIPANSGEHHYVPQASSFEVTWLELLLNFTSVSQIEEAFELFWGPPKALANSLVLCLFNQVFRL